MTSICCSAALNASFTPAKPMVPADEAGVASVERVSEHPLERVLANEVEERPRPSGKPGHCVLLQRAEHGVLLRCAQVGEVASELASRVGIHGRKPG